MMCYTRIMDTKQCTKCKKILPVSEFHSHAKTKSGLQSWCKGCSRDYNRANRKPLTEQQKKEAVERQRKRYRANPEAHKNWNIKNKYGITREQYDEILSGQDGRCPICKTDDPGGKGWCVDHDHSCCAGGSSCGKCVRGILCNRCNMGLGYFQDSVDVLSSAIRYLIGGKNA